ncbi:MAG: hypothetical protein PHS17_03315, partial [Desulfobacterales bacterium]|nr:hypothetical protein [Desulfobacterales bacterium]
MDTDGDGTAEVSIDSAGSLSMPTTNLTDGTDTHTIKAVQETGLGGRLTFGLDETARTMVICDYGAVDTDFGLSAASDPSIFLVG